jgi:hypothetical protein
MSGLVLRSGQVFRCGIAEFLTVENGDSSVMRIARPHLLSLDGPQSGRNVVGACRPRLRHRPTEVGQSMLR